MVLLTPECAHAQWTSYRNLGWILLAHSMGCKLYINYKELNQNHKLFMSLQEFLLYELRKIFFCPISEEDQPGVSDAFLHKVVFLIDHYSCMGLSTGRFTTRVSEKNSAKSRKSQTLTWPQVNKHSPRNFQHWRNHALAIKIYDTTIPSISPPWKFLGGCLFTCKIEQDNLLFTIWHLRSSGSLNCPLAYHAQLFYYSIHWYQSTGLYTVVENRTLFVKKRNL